MVSESKKNLEEQEAKFFTKYLKRRARDHCEERVACMPHLGHFRNPLKSSSR